jgi:hypothetical protein
MIAMAKAKVDALNVGYKVRMGATDVHEAAKKTGHLLY